MKILQEEGSFQIMERTDDNAAQFIEAAGRTCYRSEDKITDTSAEKFVKKIIKSGHHSVLEHWSIVWDLDILESSFFYRDMLEIKEWTVGSHYTILTPHRAIVSMNVRTLRDAYKRTGNLLARNLIVEAREKWPILFHDMDIDTLPSSNYKSNIYGEADQVPNTFGYEEFAKHIYLTARFVDHCRGFTHEDTRHRPCAFSQESTRNVEQNDLHFVMPPRWGDTDNPVIPIKIHEVGQTIFVAPDNMVRLIEQFYSGLLDAGWKPQDARQFLPIGVTSEIVHTANLREWLHIFSLRCDTPAHWEIKRTMRMLLRYCIDRWPMFESLAHLLEKE